MISVSRSHPPQRAPRPLPPSILSERLQMTPAPPFLSSTSNLLYALRSFTQMSTSEVRDAFKLLSVDSARECFAQEGIHLKYTERRTRAALLSKWLSFPSARRQSLIDAARSVLIFHSKQLCGHSYSIGGLTREANIPCMTTFINCHLMIYRSVYVKWWTALFQCPLGTVVP